MTTTDSAPQERGRLLIVDDQPVNLSVCKAILETDYDVETALSGERALQIAGGPQPLDLILLDVMMPGLSGYDVCRRLKASPQTERIPVIFLTGKHEVDDEAKGFERGCADYIIKPFHATLVKARVAMHLRRFQQEKLLLTLLRELGPAGEQKYAERVRALSTPSP